MQKVALIQSQAYPTKALAYEANERLIIEAAEQGAKIVCTQELFLTPYFCQVQDTKYFELAEEIQGPLVERLQALAARFEIVIVASLFEKQAVGIYYNTSVTIDADGEVLGVYRKQHIPQDPGFEEKFYFTPGDGGYPVWKTRYGTIGVLICWDQWFPEAARLMALQGAEIIFYPTAIGWLPEEKAEWGRRQHQAWETVQRGHAVANGCYIAAINRVGRETMETESGAQRVIDFWGQSFASDPYGEVLVKGSESEEEVLYFSYESKVMEDFRQIWPFFRDRRVDTYEGISSRWLS